MEKIARIFCFSLFLSSLFAGFPAAIAQLRISAEVRPRAELRNGFKKPLENGEKAAFFIEQRTRIYLEHVSGNLELVLAPQDIRIWGSTSQIYKEDPSLTNLYQGWAAYKFNDHHKIAAGRMALDYDNARILGNLDWAQQGRSHDLLKYEFRAASFKLHAGLAFNQDSRTPEPQKLSDTYYAGVNNYKTMQFLWLNKAAGKASFSFLFLNDGRQFAPDTVYYMQTAGVYAELKAQPLSLSGEFYYQGGKNGAGHGSSAMLASLQASTRAASALELSLGADYLSGNDPATARHEAFDPQYGTNHKFYGLMDYFYVGNPHQDKGLVDIYGRAAWKGIKGPSIQLHIHRFSAASDVPGDTPGTSRKRNFGTEADLALSWMLSEDFTVQGGYSQMFPSRTLEAVKGTDDPSSAASWGWLMLVFRPVLLDHTETP